MMRVFPVGLVPHETSEAVYVTRGGQRKRCSVDRIWYADWHDVDRDGPGPRKPHRAQDIFAPQGSLVLAPEEARVLQSTKGKPPTRIGGHTLTIRAPASGRVYYFAHLRDAPLVGPGDVVDAGQLVGHVGRTGNARNTCPHLHLQAWKGIGARRVYVNLFAELRALDPTVGGRLRRSPSKPPTEAKEKPCRA